MDPDPETPIEKPIEKYLHAIVPYRKLLIVVGLGLICLIGVIGVYRFASNSTHGDVAHSITADSESGGSISSNYRYTYLITNEQKQNVLDFIGTSTLSAIEGKYPLFVSAKEGEDTGGSIKYIDDGLVESGSLKGYKRIIAEIPQILAPSDYLVFATKDYKTFFVDSDDTGLVPNPNIFNTKVVVGVAPIPTNFPKTIPLDATYSLVRSVALDHPEADLPLSGDPQGLTLRYAKSSKDELGITASSTIVPTYTTATRAIDVFVESNSAVEVTDKEGVTFVYHLKFSQDTVVENDNGNLRIIPNRDGFYTRYGELFAGHCAGLNSEESYVLKNITDDDLVDTGMRIRGTTLYTFKDSNHPIIKAQYYIKTAREAGEFTNNADGSTSVFWPGYEQYAEKHPVLLFKDFWGRWVAVGEQQYTLPGGCGKPVIYLYPKTPQDVRVTFAHMPEFTKQIPVYSRGWYVHAQPDGALADLQRNATNCDALAVAEHGSEYAKDACAKGVYPYLFWAGEARNTYPYVVGGWVVARADVARFLEATLHEIGLSDTELHDMTEYWVPELLAHTSPYFRISFFTNKEMNQFIPMEVTPRPDSVLRVFLDWKPLDALPKDLPTPQIFEPFERSGFTYVEWGGLKQ